jgi:hypothetical protein
MNQRRPRSDDVLFISALATILLGLAFLLYTTKIVVGPFHAWPVLVIAAGGVLIYFALVRGFPFSFFIGGLFFALEGAFFIVSMLLGWEINHSWPLSMIIAGVTGFISGLAAKKRLKTFLLVPSVGFTALGLVFSVFSFGLAKVEFKSFIVVWWPTLLIAGGISLFVAYGLSRHGTGKRAESLGPRAGKRASAPEDSPGRDRGPSSGP